MLHDSSHYSISLDTTIFIVSFPPPLHPPLFVFPFKRRNLKRSSQFYSIYHFVPRVHYFSATRLYQLFRDTDHYVINFYPNKQLCSPPEKCSFSILIDHRTSAPCMTKVHDEISIPCPMHKTK